MGLNEALIYVDNIVNALSYYDKKIQNFIFKMQLNTKKKLFQLLNP